MQSIRVTLFSGSPPHLPVCISVPILNPTDLTQRVEDLAIRHQNVTRYLKGKSHVNCRELFQKGKPELFFFPSSSGKCVSLQMMDVGEIFFLRHRSYGFIFCFKPNAKSKFRSKTRAAPFLKERGYPAGVTESNTFFFSAIGHISILVSEHGRMTATSNGEWIVRGIEIAFLQKKKFHGKSVFVQRKNECVSPNRPLSEDFGAVNPFQMNKKYIKVRCICKTPGFCYSAKFPVLSEEELQQAIIRHYGNRLHRYGKSSRLSSSGHLELYLLEPPKDKHLIMFPNGMGIDVPFGDVQGGQLFFSYEDKTLPGCSSKKFKLIFFPSLFNQYERLQIYANKIVKDLFKKEQNTAVSFCVSTKATIFTSSLIKLVSCSSSEYKLDGAKVEMISTKNHGGWSVCFSCETRNLASSSVPECSDRNSYAYGSSFPSLPRATVSVPLGKKGKQTQKRKNSSSVTSGIKSKKSTTQVTATVSVPPERQGQQTQQRRSPLPETFGVSHQLIRSIPLHPPAESTAFVPFEQTQQKRSKPAPGAYGVSFRSYGSHPYGPLPFCEGLYSYRSPITPHHQAAATVSISPGQQGQQTQQEGRSSSLSGSSGIEHRETTASFSQAEATVVVPPEQQRSRTPLRETFGVRHQLIRPIPFRSQPEFTAFMQFEQTQQGRSRPTSGFYGISSHTYFQHEPWPFSGGFYPYGYPYPPCPYPPARQGQWMPVFPPPFSDVRPPVAAFGPLRYEISVQKEDVGHSGRKEASAAVPVGSVQQVSIWRPYEEGASAAVFSQAQAENSSEETD